MAKKSKAQKRSTASGVQKPESSIRDTNATDKGSKWTQIEQISFPEYVRDAIQKLNDAGFVAYVVGGSIRDILLDRSPKDHDIASSAPPDEIEKLFPKALSVGKKFGVFKVPVATPGRETIILEISSFRTDLEYKNHRRPEGIALATVEEDAVRRDFTINAMFYDSKTSRVFDPTGGMEDLKQKNIRAIGKPDQRFQEDALRLLRMIRFSTALGFEIEKETAMAARSKAHLIKKISVERVRDEMDRMLMASNPERAIRLLAELDLLPYIVPEVEALKKLDHSPEYQAPESAWEHTLKILETVAKMSPVRSRTVSWAALLIDIGKPLAERQSAGSNFNGHEVESARLAREIGSRLKMTNNEVDTLEMMLVEHLKFKEVFNMREATLLRWIRQPYFSDLLSLHRADSIHSGGNLAYYDFCASRLKDDHENGDLSDKLITGQDLIELGLRPGPEFSNILRVVEDLALEKKLGSKEQALEFVVKHYVN